MCVCVCVCVCGVGGGGLTYLVSRFLSFLSGVAILRGRCHWYVLRAISWRAISWDHEASLLEPLGHYIDKTH